MHMWYVDGLKFEVLSLHQDKPHTMVHLEHVSNGVTYRAHGWTRWDGKEEWMNGRGTQIAMTRARRKIAARLKWEAELRDQMLESYELSNAIRLQAVVAGDAIVAIDKLHRDGGTVSL